MSNDLMPGRAAMRALPPAAAECPAAPALTPIHPAWCPHDCQVFEYSFGQEVFHESEEFSLDFRYPKNVVDLKFTTSQSAKRSQRGVLLLMKFEVYRDGRIADGTDEAQVVLDLPDNVTSMTPEEAARLGAALIRASRRLGRGAR